MKKILAGIIALSMSVCMFSCSDSKEESVTEDDVSISSDGELSEGEENITDDSSESSDGEESSGEEEPSREEKFLDEEKFFIEDFASLGYEKINEIIATLKNDGLELSDICIYSTNDMQNFNITDSACELIRSEIEKYDEMQTNYDYFFVIQDYKCLYFVCTDGTENVRASSAGTQNELDYQGIYNTIFDEISVQ